MRRPPPVHEFKPDHTEGQVIGPAPADVGPGKYKNIQQILIGGIIVGVMALLMLNAYRKARAPAYMVDCLGRLHALAQAFEMYDSDHNGQLPPAAYWRYALSSYVDVVGLQTDEGTMARRRARPRGFSSPMRCIGNRTTTPISYLYADPMELGPARDDPNAPLLVDEVHHTKTLVLRRDLGCVKVAPQQWLDERQGVWQIARRLDWPTTFAYVSTRPRPPVSLDLTAPPAVPMAPLSR